MQTVTASPLRTRGATRTCSPDTSRPGASGWATWCPPRRSPHTPGELHGPLHEKFFGDGREAIAWLAAAPTSMPA